MKDKPKTHVEKVLPWILVIAGIIGLLMSGIILWEKIQILQNPAYKPNCNLDPVISCGSVTSSKQAAIFGFPNPFIGLVAFAVVTTTGMVIFAGATLKKWYWLGLEIGTILGIAFTHWLFFESVYRIHALCPYCMVVWLVTFMLFLYVTSYNLQKHVLSLPKKLQFIGLFIQKHQLDLLIAWMVVIASFILHHFWYYYGPRLHL